MDFALYSLGIVLGFAIVRWLTENIKFHIRTNSIWLHHWIIAFLVMLPLFYFQIDEPLLWGALTGLPSKDLVERIGPFVGKISKFSSELSM